MLTANRALAKVDAATKKTARELVYIHALHLFFGQYIKADYYAHAAAYADAKAKLVADSPAELEADAFDAEALTVADPSEDVVRRSMRFWQAVVLGQVSKNVVDDYRRACLCMTRTADMRLCC